MALQPTLKHYEDHVVTMHASLDRANLNTINISTQDFHLWQHFDSNCTTALMHKLVYIPEVPVTQQSEPILPFEINRDLEEGTFLAWKLLTYPQTYTGIIGMILAICVGIYCLQRSWLRPPTPRH